MSTDQTHRDRVRREALAAGQPPDVADYLAQQVGIDQQRVRAGEQRSRPAAPAPLSRSLTGKQPTRSGAPRASGVSRPQTRTVAAVAAMYGPRAVALVHRFAAAGLSTHRVTEMLNAETGNAPHLGEIGAKRLAYQLGMIPT